MPELTAEQLLLLEQLTYLDGSGVPLRNNSPGITSPSSNNLTLGEILDSYDFSGLKDNEDYGTGTTGKDWRNLINAIRNDPQLRNLRIYNDHQLHSQSGQTIALVFYSDDAPKEAIVAFQGTADKNEWADNLEGANLTDTPEQQRALEFINNLSEEFDSFTVTGHSKGGNKAAYVALLSDKVKKAFSFDGQGFSPEFYAKYADKVKANADKITCYAMNSDFVHELLYEIPGATYLFVIGQNVESFEENHVLHKMLTLEDGSYSFQLVSSELPQVQKLRELANYVVTTAGQNGHLDKLIPVLSFIVVTCTDGALSSDEKTAQLIEYIKDPENQDELALLLAYLVRYLNDYHVSRDDIDEIAEYLGFNPENPFIDLLLEFAFVIKDQLSDKDDDYLSKFLLSLIPSWSSTLTNIWSRTEQYYREIPAYDRSSGVLHPVLSQSETFNYSAEHQNGVHDVISGIENAAFQSIDNWRSYAGEDWYGSLLVDLCYRNFHNFYTGLSEANVSCRAPIDEVFSAVSDLDAKKAAQISDLNTLVRQLCSSVECLAQGQAPSALPAFPCIAGVGMAGTTAAGPSSNGLSGAVWTIGGAAAIGSTIGGSYSADFLGYSADGKIYNNWNITDGEFGLGAEGEVEGHLASGEASGRFGLLNGSAGLSVGNAAVGGSIGATLFQNGSFRPSVNVGVEADASVLDGNASVSLGTDGNNIHADAEGSLLSANAHADAGVGYVTVKGADGEDKTAFGVSATAGAEAYVAEGSVSGGFSFFGIDIDVGLEGKAGGAGVEAGGSITTNGVSGKIGAGIGIGGGLSISIDWSDFKWPKLF